MTEPAAAGFLLALGAPSLKVLDAIARTTLAIKMSDRSRCTVTR
jgi:hypothetical protein